jgi:hypothetical protein
MLFGEPADPAEEALGEIIQAIQTAPAGVLPYLPRLILGAENFRDPRARRRFEELLLPVIAARMMEEQFREMQNREDLELQAAIQASLQEQRMEVPPVKKVTFRRHTISLEESRQNLECVVCINPLLFGDEDVVEVKCGHMFHRKCISGWTDAHDTCPLCRADIGDGD